MSATPNINLLKIQGNKFDATTAPGATADSSAGYQVGSKWIDVTNDKAYNCVDATTGAAVWNEAGGGGSSIFTADGTLTGNRTVNLGTTNDLIFENSGTSTNFKLNNASSGYVLNNRSGGIKIRPVAAGNQPLVISNTSDNFDTFTIKANGGGEWSAYNGVKIGELTTNDYAKFTIYDLEFYKGNTIKHKIGFGENGSDVDFWIGGVSSNNSFRVGGNTLIGTESISLQGNTLIKGSDNSASTSGFKIVDTNDDSKWDFRNNGDILVGQDVNIVGDDSVPSTFTFCRPANPTGYGAGFNIDLHNSSSAQVTYARFVSIIESNTAGSHTGRLELRVADSGTVTTKLTVNTGGIVVAGNTTSESTSSNAAFIAKGDGSSQDGYIQLNCSQNSHGIKLKSPAHSAAASYTLTFPNDTGSNGQFLKTDGSGVLSWGAAGSSSPLTTKGDVYTYDTADARLPVGTNGQALIANSSTSTGLEWQNLPGQSTGSGTKVLVKGAMGADQTVGTSSPVVEFVDSGTPAGGAFDVNGEWDNTNHRFTVASSGAGTYLIQSQLFLTNGTGWSTLYLYKNGSIYSAFGGNGTDTVNTWDNLDGTIAIDLVVGDYIDIRAYSSASGTISFSQWPTRQAFSINKIGESVTVNNVTLQTLNKTFTLQEPTASDDITVFRTDVAITVQEVIACSTGSSPSTTYQLKHHTDRSNAGNALTTSAATTSDSTGDVASLDDATIPANSWVWIETSAASGTSVYLSVDIRYTED